MSDFGDDTWEPFRVGTEQYYDPRTGRYTYRRRGRFAPMPEVDLPPSIESPEYELPVTDDDEGDYLSPLVTDAPGGGSTRVKAIQYNYTTQKLYVDWVNGKPSWVYHDVPRTVFDEFVNSDSWGKYVNQVLNSFSHNAYTYSVR